MHMHKLLVVVIASAVLSGCTVKNLFVKKPSGLDIATVPAATVTLNGENVGETPYSNKTLKPGEYTITLTPKSGDFSPYEIKRKLESQVGAVISRTFGATEDESSHYILMLEPSLSDGTYLSVISEPDAVNVNLDDKPYGFTPLSKIATTPGTHTLSVSSPGYISQSIPINPAPGYNLVVSVKLASDNITLVASPSPTPSGEATPSALPAQAGSLAPGIASPSPSPLVQHDIAPPYVTVSDVPDTRAQSGLNVRKDASSSSDPLGKAKIGEKLPYLGETTPAGWHKVEFEGTTGYVSGKYVTLTK